MTLMEKLEKRLEKRTAKITILDNIDVNCRLYTVDDFDKLEFAGKSDEENAEFLSKQFTDPNTSEPVFTPDMILKKMSNRDAHLLMRAFVDANIGSLAEKN